ncbi:MAG: FHA domain-containing protein [Burkholderiales bacterium]|nr:FHA domain-containing protein [Burkholderiales bacterium]MEB2335686.1 FHA domain-containing protein [Burkholderiales bacterium]
MADAEHPGMRDREAAVAVRLLVSSGQSSLRVVPVVKECLTIGRRPYNDIALDDLTVSGEHALVRTRGTESVVHDLDSRNGTLVNGMAVSQRVLCDGDVIDIGIYRLRYVLDRPAGGLPVPGGVSALAGICPPTGFVDFLNGPLAGTVQRIDRSITRLAGQAEQVAVVSRRKGRFFITHLEGPAFPQVNGEEIGLGARALADGDLIELAGVMLRFRLGG